MSYYQEFPDFSENIEKIFNSDVRDKKQTGNGVHGRAARLRKHEAVIMPSDRLNKFDRKLITGQGVMKIYTIKEAKTMDIMERINSGEIPNYTELEELGFDEAQKCLAEIRRLHVNVDIGRAWKMTQTDKMAAFFDKYMVAKVPNGPVIVGQAAVEYRKKTNKKRNRKNAKDKNLDVQANATYTTNGVNYNTNPAITYSSTPTTSYQYNIPDISAPITGEEDQNIIAINRRYSNSQLVSYLERLSLYLDPEKEFEVEIKIKEIRGGNNE